MSAKEKSLNFKYSLFQLVLGDINIKAYADFARYDLQEVCQN